MKQIHLQYIFVDFFLFFLNKIFKLKDPSIQRVTENVQITQRSLDDYNPFAQSNIQSVISIICY